MKNYVMLFESSKKDPYYELEGVYVYLKISNIWKMMGALNFMKVSNMNFLE